MSKVTKKYVRAKRICSHPNKLFEEWLKEWQSDAKEKGSNMQYNYHKALKSLQNYPLPLKTGTECKILANFGEKICAKLDQKLATYIAECGPIDWDKYIKLDEVKPRKRMDKTKTTTGKIKTPIKPKLYVPALRSGGYAILRALYENHKASNSTGYMNKKDLIKKAQSYCDASFLHPPDGSRYTAWSSMSTLIKKGLVGKESSPARYLLTEIGLSLATDIIEADSSEPSSTAQSQTSQKTHDMSDSDSDVVELEEPSPAKSSFSAKKTIETNTLYTPVIQRLTQNLTSSPMTTGSQLYKSLQFTYVDTMGRDVTSKEDASVNINELDCTLGFLIKCKTLDLTNSSLTYRLATGRKALEGISYAYLEDSNAPDYCPGMLSMISPIKSVDQRNPSAFKLKPPVETAASHILKAPKRSQSDSTRSAKVLKVAELPKDDIPEYTLNPGKFKIVLCVDNQEVCGGFGGKNGTKNIIVDELTKFNVEFHVRKLHVGDFLWVCQEISTIQPRELVLPYVIERKRMDDLASSIKDGRFREQKFRLKQSSLSNPIYLVENYGSKHAGLPLSTCQQAVSNTQYIHGFHIKCTKDQKESASYLTMMTKYLKKKCENKILRSSSICSFGVNDEVLQLLDFTYLNAKSMKNKQLCIRDMFTKHLLQLHGLSVDKASAIVSKYETPVQLMKSLEKCCNDQEKEKLLAMLKAPISGRAIGPVISKQIARLYSWKNLE